MEIDVITNVAMNKDNYLDIIKEKTKLRAFSMGRLAKCEGVPKKECVKLYPYYNSSLVFPDLDFVTRLIESDIKNHQNILIIIASKVSKHIYKYFVNILYTILTISRIFSEKGWCC
jgi:hypothetical protein